MGVGGGGVGGGEESTEWTGSREMKRKKEQED